MTTMDDLVDSGSPPEPTTSTGRQAAIASGLGWGLVLLSVVSGLLGNTLLSWVAQVGFGIMGIFLGVRALRRDADAPRADRRLAWLGVCSGGVLLLLSALEVLVIVVSLSHD